MEDSLLVFRCKQGSKDALGRIYKKYRDYLLILAVALSHNASLSEDAVHDVFVSFAEKLAQFKLTGSLKAYLATCVANRIRELMRNQQAASLKKDCLETSDLTESSSTVVCNEELNELSSALSKLSNEQREVIVLHIHGQMRFRSIAELLGISVNTVKGRYRYGINRLRSILNIEVEK